MTFQSGHRGYRPDIDGLRAVAVIPVVFYHAGLAGFTGGFVGVDIFFVISGFLITGIVWSELNQNRFSLQNFYVRRIKRIFPALFAVLFFTSVAAFFLLIPQDLTEFGKSVDAAILFFSNFHFLKAANYFDGPAIEKPLLHTWSLSVEEQFYAVWPLVLLLLSRIVPARRVPQIIVGLCLISLILAEARLPDHQKDAFYLPWCRGWELLLGALLAVTSVTLRPGRLASVLGAAGLAAIVAAVAFYDPSTSFPGLAAVLPCAGAALIIFSGNPVNPVSRILSFGPVRQIGLISYSLYLIHWPLFSFAHLYFSQDLSLGLRLGIIALSFVLAYASWRFIETPFRRASLPRFAVFGAAAAAMGCFYLAGFSFIASHGFPFRVDEAFQHSADYNWEDSKYCRAIDVPGAKGGVACALGEDRGGSYDFILWGDSHAHHFVPAVNALAKARKLSGALFWRPACHPFLDDPHTAQACRDFNAAVTRFAADHSVKLAILAGRWVTHRGYLRQYLAQASPAENAGGLAKTLAHLNAKGITVSVLDQVPYFPQEVGSCIERARFYRRSIETCVTQPAAVFASNHRILDDYFAFLKRDYIFSVASATAALCDSERCRAHNGQSLLMWDSHHLTEAGSLFVMPYLKIPLLNESGKETAGIAEPSSSKGAPPL